MPVSSTATDMITTAEMVDLADSIVHSAIEQLRTGAGPDVDQVLAYDVAHAASAAATARSMLDYGAKGETEAALACAFCAEMLADLSARIVGRESLWGLDTDALRPAASYMAAYRDPAFLAGLATTPGPLHLSDDMDMVRDTFRAFATDVVAPHAEHVHRTNADVPEEIITGLADVGAFGLSVPAEYGGFSEGVIARQSRYWRLAHHTTRNPHPGVGERWHRGAEADLVASTRGGRGHARCCRHRTRLRQRCCQH
jgi:(2S)-methylsuccinyl-CoA dehydrogenase